MIIVGILQPGLTPVIIAVALVNWAGFARIIRAETISLREREFVEAARALGVSPPADPRAPHRPEHGRRARS